MIHQKEFENGLSYRMFEFSNVWVIECLICLDSTVNSLLSITRTLVKGTLEKIQDIELCNT